MDNLKPLLNMGFSTYQLEAAYISGCKTVEEAVTYLTENPYTDTQLSTAPRLILDPGVPHSVFTPTPPRSVTGSPIRDLQKELETEEPVNSEPKLSGTTDDEFLFNQTAAKKLAMSLKRERLARDRERELLLAEIKSDQEARRSKRTPVSSVASPIQSTGFSSTSLVESNGIRIKVYSSDTSSPPITLTFNSATTYRELLEAIQHSVLDAAVFPQHHLSSENSGEPLTRPMRITDSCILLVLNTWPRQTLPQCTSLSLDNDGYSPELQRTLPDLGLSDGVTIRILHVNCPFSVPSPSPLPPGSSPVPESHAVEPESLPGEMLAISDSDNESRGEEYNSHSHPLPHIFPPGGQQLVPQPPGEILPPNTLTAGENARRAALRRETEALTTRSALKTTTEPGTISWLSPSSLMDQCLRRLLDLLTHYLQLTDSRQIDLQPSMDGVTEKFRSLPCAEYWAVHTLSHVHWPEYLAEWLIHELCAQFKFNVRTASILRNCATRLNLDSYGLVTSDLIFCLTNRWPDLTHLHLSNLQTGQISAEAVCQLRRLRSLQFLNLNGLTAVCDRNIGDIVSLPKLAILRVSNTHVTDEGWNRSLNSSCPTTSPLLDLECAGLLNNLTNIGLKAIVRLFPNLRRLNVAKSALTHDPTPDCPSPKFLSHLNVSDVDSLEALPYCLIPSRTNTHPGLVDLSISRCSRLNLSVLLDQLTGHPLRHIQGLETLNSLTADLLKRYCGCGFPLVELCLRSVNLSWMTHSPSTLWHVLRSLPTSTLVRLSLPQSRIQQTGNQSLADVLCLLSRFTMLETLDLGNQVETEPELFAVKNAICLLIHLKRLIVINLPRSFEPCLRAACLPTCSIRIQHFL